MPAELIILGNPKGRTKRRALLRHAIARARGRAIRLAGIGRRKPNPAEMVILGANPAAKVSEKAAELYQDFHGMQPKELLAANEVQNMPHEVVVLGDLESLTVDAPKGEMKIGFEGDGVKLASNSAASQLYFVAGNQNLNAVLAEFGAPRANVVRLGAALKIIYSGRKAMDGSHINNYVHEFGEDDGKRPVLWYDVRIKRLYLVGGNYRIEAAGIIN
jgi:hypothetical protein